MNSNKSLGKNDQSERLFWRFLFSVNIGLGRPLFVKLIPELAVAALKAKCDKELALWFELRALNSNGSGTLILNHALAALVYSFGYSEKTAYRLLKTGNNRLWDVYQSPRGEAIIKIYRLRTVCEYLNTFKLSRPVEIKAQDFKGRRAKRAWLYASFFKPDGSRAKPISRDSIKVATGVTRRQQQRYDKIAGIKRVANFAVQQDSKGKIVLMLDLVDGKSKEWSKVRRLGNTYHSKALKAHRGMLKKVNVELRQRSLERGEARLLIKRFFLTPKSVARATTKAQEAFLLVNKRDRLVKGRLEWCLV